MGQKEIATLKDMLAAGHYDWVNPNINAQNFPVKPELYTTEGARLFHFGCVMTTTQVEAAIRAEGYEPDGIEKLLAYGEEHPDEQRKYPIVGLGSSCEVDGLRFVPFLYEGGHGRLVDLDWDGLGDRWLGHYRFLASPQVKH